MATRRHKIARSAIRRVKRRNSKNTKLKTLRSRKNTTEKKARLNMREMKGGGVKNAYLVYYGPPILRSNPKLRTRTTFVGVLLYEKEDWSLCISSYLGNVNEISEAWNIAKHKFEVMKSNESLSTTSSLGPGFAKAKKIYDTIGNFDTNNIVCEIISELCVLTDDQFENLSKFINSNSGKYRTTWLRDEAPRWPFFINWIITFKKRYN